MHRCIHHEPIFCSVVVFRESVCQRDSSIGFLLSKISKRFFLSIHLASLVLAFFFPLFPQYLLSICKLSGFVEVVEKTLGTYFLAT